MWMRAISRQICGLILTALLGGLAAATLVRLAPGFDVDERELDPRLSEASLQSVRTERAKERNLTSFYWNYLRRLAHGDLGISHSLRRPVAELLLERGPVTLRLAGWGLAGGWALGLSLAMAATTWKQGFVDFFSVSFASVFLCLPAAVIGLLALFSGVAPAWAIALIVFPKVFNYARGLLGKAYQAPHVLLARAKGLRGASILLRHVLPGTVPELLALAGVSVSMALSAAIPLEAVCDVPGIGQLAWQAALGRDLPVLVSLTLFLTLATRIANTTADLAISAVRIEES
ncbi:MAG: binding-protein-dependent transport system inner rane component [Bryobacterales bacterium]|nr:binding-protein-dependent transport system inner rane component [Bryobacterales bacterium]